MARRSTVAFRSPWKFGIQAVRRDRKMKSFFLFFFFFFLAMPARNNLVSDSFCAWRQCKTMSELHNVTATHILGPKKKKNTKKNEVSHQFLNKIKSVRTMWSRRVRRNRVGLLTHDSRPSAACCRTPAKSTFVGLAVQEAFHVSHVKQAARAVALLFFSSLLSWQ